MPETKRFNIKYSTGCIILTVLTIMLLAAILIWDIRSTGTNIFTVGLVAIIIGSTGAAALWYAPLYTEISPVAVKVRRPLRTLTIPLSLIDHIEYCPPTMGAIRICGSGGFCGYWGWFREGDIGRYFAYYGRSSQCMLLELKDGRKYIIGCENVHDAIKLIESYINR